MTALTAGCLLLLAFPAFTLHGEITTSGPVGSWLNLIGNLGSASAAVLVVYMFLLYMKRRDDRSEVAEARRDRDNQEALSAIMNKVDEANDRRDDRLYEAVQSYQAQIQRVTEGQNRVLGEVTKAVGSLETTVASCTQMVRSLEQAVASIEGTVQAHKQSNELALGSLRMIVDGLIDGRAIASVPVAQQPQQQLTLEQNPGSQP